MEVLSEKIGLYCAKYKKSQKFKAQSPIVTISKT